MNMDPNILLLKSAVGLIAAWIFVSFLWRDYCLDTFRENLFTLRDELFLYAAGGNIGFDNPAYRILRERMNVGLRYAHEFTLARFFLALAIPLKGENPELTAWDKALRSLPSLEVQERITHFRNCLIFSVIKYMTLRSFFLYLLVLVVKVAGQFRQLVERYLVPRMVVGIERLESEALDEDSRSREKRGPITVGAA